MRTSPTFCLLAAATLSACRSEGPDLEAERRAILAADEAWLAAAGRKDLDQTVSYWTDDAAVLPPDMPAVKGKVAIREYIASAFRMPGFSISWRSEEVTVAADGKSAYQFATNQVTAPDSTGTLRTVAGKGVVIWRKEPDGAWRAVVDIWNGAGSSPPGAPARD
jgi:ketosteroid isomerase-like protein